MKKYTQQEVEKKLIAITTQLLTESGEPYRRQVTLDASLQRHLGIDSLSRAELFQRIEKTFDVPMPDRILAEADTLNDVVLFLQGVQPATKLQIKRERISSHGDKSQVDLSNMQTLVEVLQVYAKKFPNKPHIYFQNEDGGEEVITYGGVLEISLRIAKGLRELGIHDGETVAIMQPTNPKFFYTFFGVLLAGGVPVPIYPPFRMYMLDAYAKMEARILRNAEVRVLVTFERAEKLSLLLKSFVPSLHHVTTADELMHAESLTNPSHVNSNSYAMIQYTSGSTADPKGVLLTHYNLLSNIQAYGKAIQVTSDDVAVSWLPLYHDMGLIGMWLGSLYYGIPLILLAPFSFLNHPERWLWAIHYHRGTLSGAPNFAYELCVRKIDPSVIEGLDLSSWRMAANGAEKIYPLTLEHFASKFAAYGFKKTALLPVYGLAESTVALTIPPIQREFLIDRIDRKQFEEQRRAVVADGAHVVEFVSCGQPIAGHEIRVVDDADIELPERMVGSLQFKGPSTMQGYYNNPAATQGIYHDGWMDTGDLAYIANGECYITGRRKDLIIKAGRNLYPAEIEEIAGNVPGVRQGCVAAFAMSNARQATEELIIVAESHEKNKAKQQMLGNSIKEAIATHLDVVPDRVIIVAPHVVPKTSSGKLQRAACKTKYIENKLGKMQAPTWLQVIKLSLSSLFSAMFNALKISAKFLYTAYIMLVLLITVPPTFLYVKYASRDAAVKATKRWARLLLILAFCPIKIINKERLDKYPSVVYASNHASYIDSIVMIAVLPTKTRIVAKKEVLNSRFLRIVLNKFDYLSVDRLDFSKGIEDTKRFASVLKAGHPILIFPEGTFGYAKGLRPFKLGAFKMAIETQTPICPIALNGTRSILRGDEKLMCPSKITVTVCDPIQPSGFEWKDVTELRSRVRAKIAAYCGEPTLDLILAPPIAPKPPNEN